MLKRHSGFSFDKIIYYLELYTETKMKNVFFAILRFVKNNPLMGVAAIFTLISLFCQKEDFGLAFQEEEPLRWYTFLTYPLASDSAINAILEGVWLFFTMRFFARKSSLYVFGFSLTVWILIISLSFSMSQYVVQPNIKGGEIYGATLPLLCSVAAFSSFHCRYRVAIFGSYIKAWVIIALVCAWYSLWHFSSPFPAVALVYSAMPIIALLGGFLGRMTVGFFSTEDKKDISFYEHEKCLPMNQFSKNEEEKKLDAILDKISKMGYNRLSKAEKDFLGSMSAKDK